jgi:hypothetical protein
MGCGCKNKTSTTPQPAQSQPVQTSNPQAKSQPTNESVQNAIKKTIEKYYNQNKSR